jgi:hypothetical protein
MYVSGNTSLFDFTGSTPFIATTNTYIQVNNPISGTLTPGINNRYYNVYQIIFPATSDSGSQKFRMIMLQPQATFTSLASALAEDTRSLYLGEITRNSPEFILYTRITYSTSSIYGNIGKCVIPTGGITYVLGTKASQITVGGISATNHNALSNLTWTDSGHIGTADNLAGFGSTGQPIYYPITFGTSGTSGSIASYDYVNDVLGDIETLLGSI